MIDLRETPLPKELLEFMENGPWGQMQKAKREWEARQTIEVSEWRFDDLASSGLTTSPKVEAFDQEGN